MGAQRLSNRSIRRIERATGLRIQRAWAHGGYIMDFVTPDHRHGWWDKRTGEYAPMPEEGLMHYTTCDTTEWETDGPPIPDAAPRRRAALEAEPTAEQVRERMLEVTAEIQEAIEQSDLFVNLRPTRER